MCDAKEIPYIHTHWDFGAQLPSINLHPHPNQLAAILKDLTISLEWTSFTIFYETGEVLLL